MTVILQFAPSRTPETSLRPPSPAGASTTTCIAADPAGTLYERLLGAAPSATSAAITAVRDAPRVMSAPR
jgi:hypothetical protein